MTHTLLGLDFPHWREATRIARARRALTGPLLLVARDDDATRGALGVAAQLARRARVSAHVLTVVPPISFPVSLLAGVDREALDEGRAQRQLARVRQRVHQAVGRAAHFSTSAEGGRHAPTVARAARERGAELILMGLETAARRGGWEPRAPRSRSAARPTGPGDREDTRLNPRHLS
jgi:nucleotide-binding universal stress UspA family protein